ncbi:hypothetical protein chiPu_0030147 [Chiloscyllium punctatum]|uniref:Uncharacterized protein n=1 Tax=Chiloscyllium punctatum TaxID=137246 RepID=A0A401TTP2_CHIPU|nr:hypothetical protein [Chiloscyllium punctatum]
MRAQRTPGVNQGPRLCVPAGTGRELGARVPGWGVNSDLSALIPQRPPPRTVEAMGESLAQRLRSLGWFGGLPILSHT